MSTDPVYARGSDRAAQEDQDLRAPLTEYPEEQERDAEGAEDGSNPGFGYGREHELHNDERAEEADYAASSPESAQSAVPTVNEPAADTAYGTATSGTTADSATTNNNIATNNSTTNGAQNDVVIAPEQNTDFRSRWREIQAEFIDDPQQAAKDADHLVAEITKVFAEQAERERTRLSSAWQQKGAQGTEELRLVMRRYRGLIDHMLDQ